MLPSRMRIWGGVLRGSWAESRVRRNGSWCDVERKGQPHLESAPWFPSRRSEKEGMGFAGLGVARLTWPIHARQVHVVKTASAISRRTSLCPLHPRDVFDFLPLVFTGRRLKHQARTIFAPAPVMVVGDAPSPDSLDLDINLVLLRSRSSISSFFFFSPRPLCLVKRFAFPSALFLIAFLSFGVPYVQGSHSCSDQAHHEDRGSLGGFFRRGRGPVGVV